MFKINLIKVISFVLLAFFSTSCNDNSTGTEEHVDADGFMLELNEVEVYQEFEGEIITNTMILGINDILELSVHFLDHEGNEIEHEDEGGEEELNFDIVNSDIISIILEEHHEDEDHDGEEEHHELGFELIGLSVGSTTFTMSLMHDGHADYTSLPITVTVQ